MHVHAGADTLLVYVSPVLAAVLCLLTSCLALDDLTCIHVLHKPREMAHRCHLDGLQAVVSRLLTVHWTVHVSPTCVCWPHAADCQGSACVRAALLCLLTSFLALERRSTRQMGRGTPTRYPAWKDTALCISVRVRACACACGSMPLELDPSTSPSLSCVRVCVCVSTRFAHHRVVLPEPCYDQPVQSLSTECRH